MRRFVVPFFDVALAVSGARLASAATNSFANANTAGTINNPNTLNLGGALNGAGMSLSEDAIHPSVEIRYEL